MSADAEGCHTVEVEEPECHDNADCKGRLVELCPDLAEGLVLSVGEVMHPVDVIELGLY